MVRTIESLRTIFILFSELPGRWFDRLKRVLDGSRGQIVPFILASVVPTSVQLLAKKFPDDR